MAPGGYPGEHLLVVKYAGQAAEACDNLYISGLPSPCVVQAQLEAAISGLGLVVIRTKLIPDTRGQGSSAAMMQFASIEDAQSALEQLNGIAPSQIGIEANSSPGAVESALSGSGGIMGVKFSGDGSPSDNIYISGLPSPSIDMDALNDLFAASGLIVVRSKAIPDTRGTGSSAAMVQFSTVKEASEAMEALNGQSYLDCGLAANGAHGPPQKGAGKAATQSWGQPWAQPAVSTKGPPRQLAAPVQGKGVVIPAKMAPAKGAHAKGWPAQDASAKGTWAKGASAKGSSKGPARLLVKYKGTDNTPSDNLYISGLPGQGVTEDILYELFSAMGCNVVWCKHVADTKGLGRSAAMVQVGSQGEAALAIEALSGQMWSELTAEGMDPSYQAASTPASYQAAWTPAAGAGSDLSGLAVKYAGSNASGNLYLSGFPGSSVEQSALIEMFESLGLSVVRTKVIPDTKGLGHCAAMVECASVEQAAYAISKLNGSGALSAPKMLSPRSPSISQPPAKRQRVAWEAPLQQGEEPMLVKYKGQDNQPSDTVYIRGLPSPQVDASVLAQVIAALGLQQGWSKVIPDSNGIGNSAAMVQVGSPEEAAAAIEALGGQSWRSIAAEITGQSSWSPTPVKVERARAAAAPAWGAAAGGAISWARSGQDAPQTWATPSTPGTILTCKYSGEGSVASDNLYITGLPSPSADQHQLEALISSLGITTKRTKLIPDTRGTGSSAALIQLGSQEEAAAAIDMLTGQTCEQLGLEPSSGGGSAASGAGVGGKSTSYAADPFQGYAKAGLMQVKYAGQSGEPCDNLYISGLPSPQVDERELHQLFVEMGLVVLRSKVVPDTRGSGSSAAMVQFGSVEEAAAFIEEFAGKECPLNAAQTSYAASGGGGSKGSATRATPGVMNLKFSGEGNQPSDNLYITGLPSPQIDQETLNNLFSGLELTVMRMKIIPDTKGLGCSAAMVQLGSVDEAHAAINTLQGQQISG